MAENHIPSTDIGGSDFGDFGDAPSACREALSALASPQATAEEIGRIISKDEATTARVLRAINSAYFGLERKITDATEAVSLLGFQTVSSLLADLQALEPSRRHQADAFLPAISSKSAGATQLFQPYEDTPPGQ